MSAFGGIADIAQTSENVRCRAANPTSWVAASGARSVHACGGNQHREHVDVKLSLQAHSEPPEPFVLSQVSQLLSCRLPPFACSKMDGVDDLEKYREPDRNPRRYDRTALPYA